MGRTDERKDGWIVSTSAQTDGRTKDEKTDGRKTGPVGRTEGRKDRRLVGVRSVTACDLSRGQRRSSQTRPVLTIRKSRSDRPLPQAVSSSGCVMTVCVRRVVRAACPTWQRAPRSGLFACLIETSRAGRYRLAFDSSLRNPIEINEM